MKTLLLLMATVAIAATHASASASGSTAWTTERYLTQETWHSFTDLGPKDDGGPGDIYVAQQDLRTLDGRDAGLVNGYGVNLHPPYVFFHWTATLRGGTLTLASAIDLTTKTAVYPIAGGTARYAGVRGTVTLTDTGSKGSLVTLRYRR